MAIVGPSTTTMPEPRSAPTLHVGKAGRAPRVVQSSRSVPLRRPLVSVLLPCFNAETTLPLALRSVERQRFDDWECVLVDDGSTDRSAALLTAQAERDQRFRVVRCRHAGIVTALNAGLEHCRGSFVARMDADDVMHRERLALQHAFLAERPELAGVGCHVRLFPRSRLRPRRRQYEQWLNSLWSEEALFRDRFVECVLAHPSWFFRTAVLQQHRYRDVGWPEDYDLLLRLWGSGERVGVVPRRLLGWRDGESRLSRTHRAYSLESFVGCKAHFLADWIGASQGYVLWGYGDTGRTLARALLELGLAPTHIVELHPGRLGQRVAGAPVIAPEALALLTPRPRRIVVSVARAGPRGEVRAHLQSLGFQPEQDFVCAA